MNYKSQLYHPRTDKANVLSHIKTHGYEFFMKEIKKLKAHPSIRLIVEGNVLPKDFSSIGKNRLIYYSENFGGELAWIVWSIKKYHNALNKYLSYKTLLENEILLSNYEDALDILEQIENNICFSYWSTECKFSLNELYGGTEKNWELLNELSEKADENSLILFHLQLFSKKAEGKLSFNRYKRILNYDLANLSAGLKEYLYFKFGYFFIQEYSHLEYFLLTEANSSIIDRYELVINLLTDIVSDKDHKDYQLSVQVINELSEVIVDKRLDRLKEFCSQKLIEENADNQVLRFLENYTKGDYNLCIKEFPKIVEEYPSHIELFEPYIKSLIEEDRAFEKTGVSKEIDDILLNLYSLYSFDDEFDFAFENLAKKTITFSGLNSYRQLLGLISSLILIKSKNNKISDLIFVNSNFSNPILFLFNRDMAINHEYDFNSLPYKVNYLKGKGEFNSSMFSGILPDKKSFLYQIRSTFLSSNAEQSLSLIDEFLERSDLKIIDESDIFNIKFYCYLIKEEINQAITLLSNQYLINKNLCAKVDTIELLNLVDERIDEIPGSFESVIFSHFANSSSYFQFVNLDELFIEINVEYPHQLLDKIDSNNRNKIIYILEKVCNVDVLGNFLIFESRDEVVKERESILMSLLEIMPNKEEEYIDEIAKLKRLEIVKSVIKEVNDGRIYININSLDQSHKNVFQNNFDRLQSLIDYTASHDLWIIDINDKIQKLYQDIPNAEDLKKDAAYLTCKSFVNELINNFLYSEEYGLDGCLSTRIRHGALENIIRSVFERNGLIAKKTGEDYQDIEYWILDGNHINDNLHTQIQNHFKVFSKKTDDLIKFLVKEVVQIYSIKTTDKQDAIFNYYFSDDIHWIIYKDLKEVLNANYSDFINTIFDILKTHTNKILEKTRGYFKVDVKNKLISYLEELNSSINNTLLDEAYPKLTNNIKTATTEIQNVIDGNISEWFKLSEDSYQNVLDFESIINTSISLTNNNNIDFDPKIECEQDVGVYGYLHFIFIFRILFDNIIKHSKLAPSEVDASVIIDFDDAESVLKIVVKSKLNTSLNKNALNEKFKLIKEGWTAKKANQSVINKEGGSGYGKIKRILKYDLNSDDNEFDYLIEEDYLTVMIHISKWRTLV
ncbi:hypothetical protein [Winogradskyella luteola]|uniref:Uncharacterized protein n=1 Tax=Winogradskyella luteola TaxID=2828330 RepID=A0A9X1F852_9FLAO|nr:hypothetical protein [Winogradskyella luteola]MBV7268949.1 hypothetical protein [Winogradskyella luteola]